MATLLCLVRYLARLGTRSVTSTSRYCFLCGFSVVQLNRPCLGLHPCQLLGLQCPFIMSTAYFDKRSIKNYRISLWELKYLIWSTTSSPPFRIRLASNFEMTWMLVLGLHMCSHPPSYCPRFHVSLMFLACNTKSSLIADETKLSLYQGKGTQIALGLLIHQNIVPSLSFPTTS